MLRILHSAQSDKDLIAIWQYIATIGQNPDAADRLLREIDRRIQLLVQHPLMGEAQPQFGERTESEENASTAAATRCSQTWTMLIKRVYEADPLSCPQCGGQMKVISFIDPPQRDVIEQILQHCRLGQVG